MRDTTVRIGSASEFRNVTVSGTLTNGPKTKPFRFKFKYGPRSAAERDRDDDDNDSDTHDD